jgi:hypothetical protein
MLPPAAARPARDQEGGMEGEYSPDYLVELELIREGVAEASRSGSSQSALLQPQRFEGPPASRDAGGFRVFGGTSDRLSWSSYWNWE